VIEIPKAQIPEVPKIPEAPPTTEMEASKISGMINSHNANLQGCVDDFNDPTEPVGDTKAHMITYNLTLLHKLPDQHPEATFIAPFDEYQKHLGEVTQIVKEPVEACKTYIGQIQDEGKAFLIEK